MKHALTFFWGFLCAFSSFLPAQDNSKIDSLLVIYNDAATEDTLKASIGTQLFNYYLYKDQEKASEYLNTSYKLSMKTGYERIIGMNLINKGALFDLLSNIDSAEYYYAKSLHFFEKIDNRIGVSNARINLSNIAFKKGEYAQAIEILQTNIQEDSVHAYGFSHSFLANAHKVQGHYILAINNALIALKHYEKIKNELRKADTYNLLGNIEYDLKNYNKAIEYNLQASKIYEKEGDKYFLAQVSSNIGGSYLELNEPSKAPEYLHRSLALSREMGAKNFEGLALELLARLDLMEKRFENAIQNGKDNLIIQESTEDPLWIANSLLTLGNVYAKTGQEHQAIPLYNRAIVTLDSIQANKRLMNAYYARSNALESVRNYERALDDYKKYHSYSDTIFNTKKSQQIEELRIIYDTEKKEQEILLLTKNAELDQVRKTRLWISLIAAIGLASLFLWAQRERRRKEKEIEAERQKVAELENQRLTQELDFKKQELTSKVLQLCRKNEFLQSLEREVKEFKSESYGPDKNRLDKLRRKISRDLHAGKDWEQFLQSFETVHPDFMQSLLSKYPDFAPNEIRMACLMRMNLESKDIANLLNITPDGVKKARYRMRKKMGKDSSVNLREYFMKFETAKELVA